MIEAFSKNTILSTDVTYHLITYTKSIQIHIFTNYIL